MSRPTFFGGFTLSSQASGSAHAKELAVAEERKKVLGPLYDGIQSISTTSEQSVKVLHSLVRFKTVISACFAVFVELAVFVCR